MAIRGLLNRFRRGRRDPAPAILILTPVKDAADCVDAYVERLLELTYPLGRVSVGLLESDSTDDSWDKVRVARWALRPVLRRVGIWKRDFGYHVPAGTHRGQAEIQSERRRILAKSRNHLLSYALADEDWVMWLDVDVIEYPTDIIERLLATGKRVVHPHCVLDYGGRSFDQNAWRNHGYRHLDSMRGEGELVELDAVGGTMLWIDADLHRDGLVFPSWPYGRQNPRARLDHDELETEALGLLARDMGEIPWGMPNLEIRHRRY